MPRNQAGKRKHEGDSPLKQGGTQGPGMSVEQHRAESSQRAKWQRDSNTEDKRRMEQTAKRTHTKFDDDGGTTVTEGSAIPKSEIAAYKIEKGQKLIYHDEEDWRSSITKQEINAVLKIIKDKVGHEEFYAANHTFSKSILENINERLTDDQREILGDRLDIHLNKINQALSNLYSNLTIGPNINYRIDDPGTGLDANYYQVEGYPNPIMDPRSEQYQIIKQFMRQKGHDQGFSDQEFTQYILEPLERAEKIHVVLAGGYHISPEVSIWKRVDEYNWEKVPIPISDEEWSTKQLLIASYIRDDISLSDLKGIFSS